MYDKLLSKDMDLHGWLESYFTSWGFTLSNGEWLQTTILLLKPLLLLKNEQVHQT